MKWLSYKLNNKKIFLKLELIVIYKEPKIY